MSKLDYTDLDAAILAVLAKAPLTFAEFAFQGAVREHSSVLEKTFGKPEVKPAWRFVDSRLQALRKAGKILFVGPKEGWYVVLQKDPS